MKRSMVGIDARRTVLQAQIDGPRGETPLRDGKQKDGFPVGTQVVPEEIVHHAHDFDRGIVVLESKGGPDQLSAHELGKRLVQDRDLLGLLIVAAFEGPARQETDSQRLEESRSHRIEPYRNGLLLGVGIAVDAQIGRHVGCGEALARAAGLLASSIGLHGGSDVHKTAPNDGSHPEKQGRRQGNRQSKAENAIIRLQLEEGGGGPFDYEIRQDAAEEEGGGQAFESARHPQQEALDQQLAS